MKLPGGGGMSVKSFVKALGAEYSRDNVGDAAAAVTYAGVMALFPFLLFLVSLASVVITPQQAEQAVDALASVAPAEVTKIVGDRIRSLASGSSPGLLTVGALGAMWAASAGIQALMRALNIVYGVHEGRPFWKVKLVAIGMTVVAGVLALSSALAILVTPAIAGFFPEPLSTAITWLRFPAAGLVMMLLWAVLYYVLPDVQQKFKFITPGSIGGVFLWVAASAGFSAYVSHFGKYDATYGSLGGIIVMLLWMWLSSLVLLVGAEANAVIEFKSEEGKRAGAKSLADHGPSGTKTEEGRVTSPRQEPQVGARGEPRSDARDGWRPLPVFRGVAVKHVPREPRADRRKELAGLAGLLAGAFLLKRARV